MPSPPHHMLSTSHCQDPQDHLAGLPQRLPQGSCDTHFHVFGDAQTYAVIDKPSYLPAPALLGDYWHLMHGVGIERAVLIQPSVYGPDHRLYESTLQQADTHKMRGVAVAYADTHEQTLADWHELGTRGTRYNALFSGGVSRQALKHIAGKVAPLGWHVQLLVDIAKEPGLVRDICSFGLPVVVDHFGHPSFDMQGWKTGFDDLLALVAEGQVWVKLSGAYRLGVTETQDYSTIQRLLDRLMKANPERLLWGSDWPHPMSGSNRVDNTKQVDTMGLLRLLNQSLSTHELSQILVSNPHRLYWESS